jgi:cell division protease FtsH
MVTSFGMSSLGPVTIGERSAEIFLGATLQDVGSVGPGTLERIDVETRAIVERAEQRAAEALHENWPVVEAIAAELVNAETVGDDRLMSHLATVRARRDADVPLDRP